MCFFFNYICRGLQGDGGSDHGRNDVGDDFDVAAQLSLFGAALSPQILFRAEIVTAAQLEEETRFRES